LWSKCGRHINGKPNPRTTGAVLRKKEYIRNAKKAGRGDQGGGLPWKKKKTSVWGGES